VLKRRRQYAHHNVACIATLYRLASEYEKSAVLDWCASGLRVNP